MRDLVRQGAAVATSEISDRRTSRPSATSERDVWGHVMLADEIPVLQAAIKGIGRGTSGAIQCACNIGPRLADLGDGGKLDTPLTFLAVNNAQVPCGGDLRVRSAQRCRASSGGSPPVRTEAFR